METFWALWAPFGPFGASFGGPGERNEVPKCAKERFYGYHENIIFIYFSVLFGGLGSPLKLQRVVLRGSLEQLGAHWGAFGTFFALAWNSIDF